MATISLTVPNAVAARIITMMRDEYGSMIPPATTDVDAFKLVLKFWLKKKLAEYELQGVQTANQGVVNDAIAARYAAVAAAVANAESAADTIT